MDRAYLMNNKNFTSVKRPIFAEMQVKTGFFTALAVVLVYLSVIAVTIFGSKSFQLVTSPQFGNVKLCAVDEPYTVVSVSDILMKIPLSGVAIPPHVLCSQRCTAEQSCTSFNYKQRVQQCQLYNKLPRNCTVQQFCTHYSTIMTYPCQNLNTGCEVNALAWGVVDTTTGNGYISVKTNSSTSTNNRGFNIVELDVTKCTISAVRTFDTCQCSASDAGLTTNSVNMANYINGLSASTVLIGVTAGEPSNRLEVNGKNALLSLGVDTSMLEFHGKVAFVAQVGRPAVSVMKLGPQGGDNAKIKVNVQGAPWTSDVLITQLV